MNTHAKQTYIEMRDDNGGDYICPVADDQQPGPANGIHSEDCFEKDVVERYAGNIHVAADGT